MSSKMLIDASHPEETRVVVVRGNRVEEFDFESASKRQLRGNIYLAKVMRVEPSLQAAFVDYGGNRHGFLAFSEIHPDYYQIPIADRQALIDEEARSGRDEEEEIARPFRRSRRHRRGERNGQSAERRREADPALSEHSTGESNFGTESGNLPETETDDSAPELDSAISGSEEERSNDGSSGEPESPDRAVATASINAAIDAEVDLGTDSSLAAEPAYASPNGTSENARQLQSDWAESRAEGVAGAIAGEGDEDNFEIEQLGGDAAEEIPVRPVRPRRQYKIQEVIKRRQVLLVQVAKEERGNKGAALTTYLSLAGRYSVLMPNTARGGGISRKITDPADRRRLKSIAQELDVPDGMGVIVRTAGASRTKAEVKRDFEYLLRMWETVRETTLRSSAPTLVYEEGSLIKRSIRDLYNKDIDEITVAGDEGYREAKEFMRLLMPSHAKMVQPYRDRVPMFAKFGVETQLDAMFSNHVTLKSGGYIVINQAEALVAIDVNSGKSTREHNIEDTALRTNLEAAEEVSRQLRLRDLAGLIVIDFIDMEEARNNRTVERRLKDSLKNDRARIQIGRLSHFGLLEMSRQRLRAGVIEGSTIACPVCGGAGTVRSTASIALHVLRALEDALIKNSDYDLLVRARTPVALYILNQKRSHLRDLETRFGVSVTIAADDGLATASFFTLHRGEVAAGTKEPPSAAPIEAIGQAPAEDVLLTPGESPAAAAPSQDEAQVVSDDAREAENEAYNRQRRRRRRRRGRGSEREASGISANAPQPPDDALEAMARLAELGPAASSVAGTEPALPLANEDNRRSARGHLRGGRYAPPLASTEDAIAGGEPAGPGTEPNEPDSTETVPLGENVAAGEKKHRRGRTPRARRDDGSKARGAPTVSQDFTDRIGSEEPAAAEQTHSPPVGADSDQPDAHERGSANTLSGTEEAVEEASKPGTDLARPKRTGWWQRAREGSRG